MDRQVDEVVDGLEEGALQLSFMGGGDGAGGKGVVNRKLKDGQIVPDGAGGRERRVRRRRI